MSTTTEALYSTPLGRFVEKLQDAGREVWVIGFSADHKRALIADGDNRTVSVASLARVASLGRYENHLDGLAAHYYEWFPVR